MNRVKDIIIAILVCIGVVLAIPLSVALGMWMAHLMMKWGLLP